MIGCEPTASLLIVNFAWPVLFSAPVPRVFAPSLKVTVPVGVPTPAVPAFTVAVNVTGCPDTEGLTEEVTPVVEEAVPMVRKVASSICQVSGVPRVRLPCCGPAALDRISSRSVEALPFRTSRT